MSNSVLRDKNDKILNPKIPRYEKMKKKILWENPNPTSNFNTQNITLSSNKYQFLEIVYYNWVTDQLEQCLIIEKGANGALTSIVYSNSIYVGIRALTYVDETTLKLSDTYVFHFGSTNMEKLNGHAVPVRIYGYYS